MTTPAVERARARVIAAARYFCRETMAHDRFARLERAVAALEKANRAARRAKKQR